MLMSAHPALAELDNESEFVARHIGIDAADERHMLSVIGAASRQALIAAVVPRSIARANAMQLPSATTEAQALAELHAIAKKNRVLKSCIGQGYHGTLTPAVILRNVLENPAWYTAYTPYQAEISQGRLEALVNFQTMVAELTGLAIANASMLDEATAAAEAMALAARIGKSKSESFFVADDVLPQTLEVVRTRARPLGTLRAQKVAEFRDKFANPYVAASRGFIDAVIRPRQTRRLLIAALATLETKRDKNPPKKHGNIPL